MRGAAGVMTRGLGLTWTASAPCAESRGGSGETCARSDGRSRQRDTDTAAADTETPPSAFHTRQPTLLKHSEYFCSECASYGSAVHRLMLPQPPLSAESGPAAAAVEELQPGAAGPAFAAAHAVHRLHPSTLPDGSASLWGGERRRSCLPVL